MLMQWQIWLFQKIYCDKIGVEYMFINNREQCDWIREKFETPKIMELSEWEQRLTWERLLRSTRYELAYYQWQIRAGSRVAHSLLSARGCFLSSRLEKVKKIRPKKTGQSSWIWHSRFKVPPPHEKLEVEQPNNNRLHLRHSVMQSMRLIWFKYWNCFAVLKNFLRKNGRVKNGLDWKVVKCWSQRWRLSLTVQAKKGSRASWWECPTGALPI